MNKEFRILLFFVVPVGVIAWLFAGASRFSGGLAVVVAIVINRGSNAEDWVGSACVSDDIPGVRVVWIGWGEDMNSNSRMEHT